MGSEEVDPTEHYELIEKASILFLSFVHCDAILSSMHAQLHFVKLLSSNNEAIDIFRLYCLQLGEGSVGLDGAACDK